MSWYDNVALPSPGNIVAASAYHGEDFGACSAARAAGVRTVAIRSG